jgi:NAD(P)-dependent dehydrogenase (short-subunit alcohol dehydrogenase family)
MRFAGQFAVITGGSSGIGFAIARCFAAEGGRVLLVARNLARLTPAARIIAEAGGAVAVAVADVTSETDLAALFSGCGPFDHLVTAAGPMPKDAPTVEVSIADARALFEGKYWGQFLTARQAAPQIRPGGSITMFSGTLSRKPAGGVPIFASIDGAIESLGRVMAIDLSPTRVNVIAPGIIDTPMLESHGPAVRADIVKAYGARVLVGRAGTPEDVAAAALMVMANEFMTGAVLDIDGGKK